MLTVREALSKLYREYQGEIELTEIQRGMYIEYVQNMFDRDFNGYGDYTMSDHYKEYWLEDTEEDEQKKHNEKKKAISRVKQYANYLEREAHLLRELEGEHDVAYALEDVARELREIVKGD